MPAVTVSAVLQTCRSLGREPQLYRRRGDEVHIYYTALRPQEEGFIHRTDSEGRNFLHFYHRVPYLKNSPALFFSCQGTHAEQQALAAALDGISGIRAVLYRDTYLEDNWFLEICRDDADKEHGLRRLRHRTGADRVVAFGDNYNDIPLFREADLALCVANGSDEAKAAADRIIPANEEDGVAEYLQAIYNRRL
jgi:hydroxymethylpyrimidine pyrophosphatase-like HAD family hydrolase